ncbi:MAG: hypothetical protein K0S65_4027, partial [Labilithrix sp.]|nr:hypothetical protein [Labilithrix sp.]
VTYPGAPMPVLPAISSTEVRAALANGGPALDAIAELVPREVIDWARSRGLYAKSA